MRKKLHFCVTAYGAEAVENLCRYSLYTLWSAGNRRILEQELEPVFEILTSKSDFPRLQANPIFREIQARGWIHLSWIKGKPKFFTHIEHWQRVGQRLKAHPDAYLFKLAPDVLFSGSSLKGLLQAMKKSPAAIFASWHLRVTYEVADQIVSNHSREEFPAYKMVRHALANPHPLLAAYERNSRNFPVHPENIFYLTPEGCIARVLACTPMVYAPSRCQLGWHQQIENPLQKKEVCFLQTSEKFLCLSILEKDKYQNWYSTPAEFDFLEVSCWWKKFHSPHGPEISERPFFFFPDQHGRTKNPRLKSPAQSVTDIKILRNLRDKFWALKEEEKIERLIKNSKHYKAKKFFKNLLK